MTRPRSFPPASVVELIGSPVPKSRTRDLAAIAYEALVATGVIGPGEPMVLEAGAALTSRRVQSMVAALCEAQLLLVATPVYNGCYSGETKYVLDRLPRRGLAGKVAVPIVLAAAEPEATAAALTGLLKALGAAVPSPALALTTEQPAAAAALSWAEQHGRALGQAIAATELSLTS